MPDDDTLGLADGSMDAIGLADGSTMQTHGPGRCLGPHCCIHNPSDHPLRNAPLHWLASARLMLRRCEHEALHPDPDSLSYNTFMALLGVADAVPYDGWHPCCPDRCCAGPEGGDCD
jgi:hypothetical protein